MDTAFKIKVLECNLKDARFERSIARAQYNLGVYDKEILDIYERKVEDLEIEIKKLKEEL